MDDINDIKDDIEEEIISFVAQHRTIGTKKDDWPKIQVYQENYKIYMTKFFKTTEKYWLNVTTYPILDGKTILLRHQFFDI